MKINKNNLAFTLIELLVVISIIGILVAASLFGLKGARESARDAKRKTDLEQIKSAVEMYKADCYVYPSSISSPLVGDPSLSSSCLATNKYITTLPTDPQPGNSYVYSRTSTTTFDLCAHLEQGTGSVICGGSSNCGGTCNYKIQNP